MNNILSKQKIKYIQSLKIKKYRQMYGNFIVEGEKMALELLTDKKFEVENIVALETWVQENQNILKPHFNKLLTATDADLKQISNLSTPNKVFIIAKQPASQYDYDIIRSQFCLYLDGIQDPGNMGTIMRIADWFSIPYIFCSETSVDAWNPKVIQSSMGAFLRVKTIETSFESLREKLPDVSVFATTLRGENIFKKDFPQSGIIVVGNEGSGISDAVQAQSDYFISIPGGGGAESLNAAVATGIVCAVLTQR